MERLQAEKKVHFLGISNISTTQLLELCRKTKVKPNFVQNRCYARQGWDKQVREICTSEGIAYQGFSLLTANGTELQRPLLADIAKRHGKSVAQIVFRFCQQLNMVCLTGTTDAGHMKMDLDIYDFELSLAEVLQIETLAP